MERNSQNNPRPPIVEKSDDELVASAVGRDPAAQKALFERYRDAAYQVALRVAGRHEDALDVVQDAFIRAFERLAEFQRESGFKTWLLRIVTNRALDLLRSRKVRLAASLDAERDGEQRIEVPDRGENAAPGEGLAQRELAARLQAAIEKLPPEQRAVFALFAGGLSYGEVAEAVGVPIGTVMSRLFHARRKLHELLADLAPAGRDGRSVE